MLLMSRTGPNPRAASAGSGRGSSAELFSALVKHCGGGMTAFAYVRGDPVNRRDPSGTQDICAGPRCDPDGTAVITGPGQGWSLADMNAGGLVRANQDLNTGCSFIYHPTVRDRDCDRLINWEPVRFFDLPVPPLLPPPPAEQAPERCYANDRYRNSGRVSYSGITANLATLIGVGYTSGQFSTESGIEGQFHTLEFLAGVEASIGAVRGFSRNLSTFMGGNDTESGSFLYDDISVSYDLEGNMVGAATTVAGRSFAVGRTSGFSNTDIRITRCPR